MGFTNSNKIIAQLSVIKGKIQGHDKNNKYSLQRNILITEWWYYMIEKRIPTTAVIDDTT